MSATTKAGERIYSYQEFRKITGLTKKETDSWVGGGLITAELSPDGRRRLYTMQSLMEGAVAKELADFSSRELLPAMMRKVRPFLRQAQIEQPKIDLEKPHKLLKIYTRYSREIVAGGGVRGVVAYVGWFENPDPQTIDKAVYLIVDLTLIAVQVVDRVSRLK